MMRKVQMPSITHITITVIKPSPVHIANHPFLHAVLNDGKVTEHILIGHLYTKGSLWSDATNCFSNVNSLYVFQSSKTDVSSYKCPCRKKEKYKILYIPMAK